MIVTSTTTVAAATTIEPAAFGVVAVVTLITLLVSKELALASETPKLNLFGHHLDIGVTPLLGVFAFIVLASVLEILS